MFGLVWQQRTIDAQRKTSARLQEQLAQRTAENARLMQAGSVTSAEVARLQVEVASLKAAPTILNRSASAPAAIQTKLSDAQIGTTLPPIADTETNRKKRAQYLQRYDPFFAQRGFTPEQVERILGLFLLWDDAREDLQASVREVGLSGNNSGVEALRSKLTAPISRELQQIMGDDGYAAYNRFQRTSYYRVAFVDRILPAFTSANASLTLAQTDLLVTAIAENDRPVKKNPTDLGNESRIDWDTVASRTNAFLNPAQQTALQSYIAMEKARPR